MTAHLQLVLRLLLLFMAISPASAHLGFENETEVRIYPDRMRMVLRTSYKFAAAILGERAPGSFDEQGRQATQPLLTVAAEDLFEVTSAGVPLKPTSSDCIFEPHDKVAFVTTYHRPEAWPLRFTARFFPRLASLESGSIQIFDQTDMPFGREVKPVATKRITGDDPTLSLASLDGRLPQTPVPEVQDSAPAPPVQEARTPPPGNVWTMVLLTVLAAALAYPVLRHRPSEPKG